MTDLKKQIYFLNGTLIINKNIIVFNYRTQFCRNDTPDILELIVIKHFKNYPNEIQKCKIYLSQVENYELTLIEQNSTITNEIQDTINTIKNNIKIINNDYNNLLIMINNKLLYNHQKFIYFVLDESNLPKMHIVSSYSKINKKQCAQFNGILNLDILNKIIN